MTKQSLQELKILLLENQDSDVLIYGTNLDNKGIGDFIKIVHMESGLGQIFNVPTRTTTFVDPITNRVILECRVEQRDVKALLDIVNRKLLMVRLSEESKVA